MDAKPASMAWLACKPVFHIPKNMAGKAHNQTVIIMRLRLIPSRTKAVVLATLGGV